MQLKHFLCCMPLLWGVVFVGVTYGIAYFILGTSGWQMVLDAEYNEDLIRFFRKMPIKSCVTIGSLILYLMATINIMLAYAAYTDNHRIVGTWLLVHFIVFILTLYSALVYPLLLLHIAFEGYALVVVKSFYETLTPLYEFDWKDEDSSEEEV